MSRAHPTLLMLVLTACGIVATPQVPLFAIRNGSEEPVDLFVINRAHGDAQPEFVTTLMPGDSVSTDFGDQRCSIDYTYIAEIDGREVATLGPRLCSGTTEIIEGD